MADGRSGKRRAAAASPAVVHSLVPRGTIRSMQNEAVGGEVTELDVLVVGAGLSGIGAGYRL